MKWKSRKKRERQGDGYGVPRCSGNRDKCSAPVLKRIDFSLFSLSRFGVYMFSLVSFLAGTFSFVPVCSNVKLFFSFLFFFIFLAGKQRCTFATNLFPSHRRLFSCVCVCVCRCIVSVYCSRKFLHTSI